MKHASSEFTRAGGEGQLPCRLPGGVASESVAEYQASASGLDWHSVGGLPNCVVRQRGQQTKLRPASPAVMSPTASCGLLFMAVAALFRFELTNAGHRNVEPTRGEPWPAPQQADMYDTYSWTDPALIRFKVTRKNCADLEDAIGRYMEILRGMSHSAHRRDDVRDRYFVSPDSQLLTEVEVFVDENCGAHQLPSANMDEQYVIKINTPDAAGRAQIASGTLWGAYRGLETFTQLIHFSEKHQQFHVRHGMIRDFPRYSHRGLLLDTSRHFLHLPAIRATLDLMAFNKLNVLHWHVVDDPSFPFESVTFPGLSGRGAFRRRLVYRPQHVADVVEYARQRGIRVVPEFDTPGHTGSWGGGAPGLLTACYNSTGQPDGRFGPLDPSREATYQFVRKLLDEVTTRFPDKYVHLGGDEVSFGFPCWMSNPEIKAWMEKKNIFIPEQIEDVYIQRLLKIVKRLPAKPEYVVWQEVIDNNITVEADTIVQVWKGSWEDEMDMVTSLGHRAILSSCWYLNYINYGADWTEYYDCEPESFDGTDAQNRLVIGGEACVWGEFVDDTNLIPRTWPRAAAVAERLWSPRSLANVTDETRSRMEEHRCRLLQRGYPVEPANGPGFC